MIQKIINNPEDKTKVRLLYANKAEQDILLRDELEDLQRNHSKQVKVYLTSETPSFNVEFEGIINQHMIKKTLFKPSSKHLVMHVGQPDMNSYVRELLINDMGYDEDNVFEC